MKRRVNPWHLVIALALGAVLMHLYNKSRNKKASG
jgi:hypothetical protein